jgi:hypothetical protein
MLRHTRPITLILFAIAIASVYLVCQAQPSDPAKPKAGTDVPQSLLTAGPIEPLRVMAGDVEVWLHRSETERDKKVIGALIGLDAYWVVVRVDHMNDESKRSDFQWIPVSNIERMIQTSVHPERLFPALNQPTK